MAGLDPDAFRKFTSRTLDSLSLPVTLEGLEAKARASLRSNYPVITLGSSTDVHTFMTEEQRASHIHVVGSTREGKSKLIEHLVRHNVRYGQGATVLDPTAEGQTVKDILAHCADVGYRKVIYIDPHDEWKAVPTFNPLAVALNEKGRPKPIPTDARAELLMSGLRVLWGGGKFWETPTIEKNLKHLITVLIKAQAALSDAECFSAKGIPLWDARRQAILDRVHPHDHSRLAIEAIFRQSPRELKYELGTSLSRLSSFMSYLPSLMYGTTEGTLDYVRLVRDGWLVLVNLDPERVWGEPQQVALGTLIIAELVAAIHVLYGSGWRGRHYLYVDEAARFASPMLATITSTYGKLGLWATIAHQSYHQFRGKEDVLGTIENSSATKVMFDVNTDSDRSRMLRDLFRGNPTGSLEQWVKVLKKQHAIIKIQKNDAAVLKVEDVRPAKSTPEEVEAFKDSIYASNSFYRTKEAVAEEKKKRFVRPQGKPVQGGPKPEPPASRQEPHAQPKEKERDPAEDSQRARGGAAFDGVPDSEAVLPKKARRKRAEDPAAQRP